MKKRYLNTTIVGILIFGLVAISFARTSKKGIVAELNQNLQPNTALAKPKWTVLITCCPVKIIFEKNRIQISGNARADERSGLLFLEQLKFSGGKTDELDLNEKIVLSAEDSKLLGYESIVIPAGNYEIIKGNTLKLKFKGEKKSLPNSSVCYSNKIATLKPYGKTFDVIFDEIQLKKEYEYQIAESNQNTKKRGTNKSEIQNFEEFRALLSEEIIEKTREIIPNGQPKGFWIHVERWTDKDGHRHTTITFGKE